MPIANVKVFYAAGLLAGSPTAGVMMDRMGSFSRGEQQRVTLVTGKLPPQVAQGWRVRMAGNLSHDLLWAADKTKKDQTKDYGRFLDWKRIGKNYYTKYTQHVQFALDNFLGLLQHQFDRLNFTHGYRVEPDWTSAKVSVLDPLPSGYIIPMARASNVPRPLAAETDLDPLLAAFYELATPSARAQMVEALKDLATLPGATNLRVVELNLSRGGGLRRYFVEFVVRSEADRAGAASPSRQHRMLVCADLKHDTVTLEKVFQTKNDIKRSRPSESSGVILV